MDSSPHDLLQEADRAFWRDELPESIHLVNRTIESFQQQNNIEGLVTALQNRATIHRELSQLKDYFGKAKDAHRDASISLAIVERNKLGFLFGTAYFHLAESEMLARNYEEAIIYFEQALMAFHHTGVLAQKGHYCFRLGEAHYKTENQHRKAHAREMMLTGLARLYNDSYTYPFPNIHSLLIQDHTLYAQLLLQEDRKTDANHHIEQAEKLIIQHPELVISRRKFETMLKNLVK